MLHFLLCQILRINHNKIQGLILQNEQVDPIVSNLVSLLVRCTREKDSVVSGLAGKCLGSIGAIDPGENLLQLS